ncbi:MAG: hypothetical protein M1570_06175 [Chloroflexi bacterium]|nr:hypothetical protein [Chloroflexota bacterium]
MPNKRSKRRPLSTRWLVVGAVAAVVLVGVLVGASLAATPPPSTPTALNACGTPVCGQSNAPVTIEIYSDFQ